MNSFPLLIGACPRSGTTALIQILNSNPRVFVSSEENILKLTQTLGKSLGTQERRSASLQKGMRALSVRETLTADNIHSHNFTEDCLWPSLRYIYKWHHRQLHPNNELEVWGDKLPNYYLELNSVMSLPKIRYLHITRHPLDVINSMLRRTEMARQGLDWWRAVTEFDDMLETWVKAYQAICKIKSNKRVLHIHYEDLIFDFQTTINDINKFIDASLEYENILIQDPEAHFDRSFINEEQTKRVLDHPSVKKYLLTRPKIY